MPAPDATFDEIVTRVARIEEALQLGDCPDIVGCTPHRDMEEPELHEPKTHSPSHGPGGSDPLTALPIQVEDIEISRVGNRMIVTDPGSGNRWSIHATASNQFHIAWWDGGTWVPWLTIDETGNVNIPGHVPEIQDDITIVGEPPCVIWRRTDTNDMYRICATTTGLAIESDPGGTGSWESRIEIPRDGWTTGDILAGDGTGQLLPLPVGADGLGLAADSVAPLGLTWANFGTPTSQEPGIVPIGAVVPYTGDNDPGVLPDSSQWFLCDGRPLDGAVAFPELFAIIGHKYGGSGDTFNIPDTEDMLPAGAGAGFGLPGATGGALTHQHDMVQFPEHTHVATAAPHAHNSDPHTHTSPAHNHAGNVVPAHTHDAGSLAAASHTHGAGSLVTEPHTHVVTIDHGHSTSESPHDHQSGTYVVANHSHGAGSLDVDGVVTALVSAAEAGSNALSATSLGNASVGGNTANAAPNVQGTSGTRQTGLSVNNFAGTVVSGSSGSNVAGSTGSDGAAVAGTTGPASGANWNTSNATVTIDAAGIVIDPETVIITVEDAGTPGAQTESASSLPPILVFNFIIRVK